MSVKRPSRYVQNRMSERGISVAEVDAVLAAPQTTYGSELYDDRVVVLGQTLAGRRLKIVVLKADPDHVITVADRDKED